MKKILAFLLLVTFSQNLLAQLIEESVYLTNLNEAKVKLIQSHPELTLDHMDEHGAELYGPKGTKIWLQNVGIKYKNLTNIKNLKTDIFAGYPSYTELVQNLKNIVGRYPHIMSMASIGKTVQNRDIWAIKISDNVGLDEREPEFKYVSSMHGDEITGRELMPFLIEKMGAEYGRDTEITALVNNTEIYIIPSMNPDGSELRQRANANNIDLNRNFPEWTHRDENTTIGRQPETVALMNFNAGRRFALSANFHGGAVVVNYPWDAAHELHPHDQLLQDLSLTYSNLNPAMRSSREFPRGITNGAQWYVLKGGMQDWSYVWHNDLQVTVELSDEKWPRYSEIQGFYRDNEESLVAYMKMVHQGAGFYFNNSNVNGQVSITETTTNQLVGEYAFMHGEFYKVLPKGEYLFTVKTANNDKRVFSVIVKENEIGNNGSYIQL